jgi:hypothetical protein
MPMPGEVMMIGLRAECGVGSCMLSVVRVCRRYNECCACGCVLRAAHGMTAARQLPHSSGTARLVDSMFLSGAFVEGRH